MDDDADATGEPTSRSYADDEVVDDGDDRRNESGGTDVLVDIAMVRFAGVGARARVRVSGCVVRVYPNEGSAIPTVTLVCMGKQYEISEYR